MRRLYVAASFWLNSFPVSMAGGWQTMVIECKRCRCFNDTREPDAGHPDYGRP